MKKNTILLIIFTLFAFSLSIDSAIAGWSVTPGEFAVKTSNSTFPEIHCLYTNTSILGNGSLDNATIGGNITNYTLLTNFNGTWLINDTNSSGKGYAEGEYMRVEGLIFTESSLIQKSYQCQALNSTGGVVSTSSNYTVTYFTPTIAVAIYAPTNKSYMQDTGPHLVNYSINGPFSTYTCYLFTNSNGTNFHNHETQLTYNNTNTTFSEYYTGGDTNYTLIVNCTTNEYYTQAISQERTVYLDTIVPAINVTNMYTSGKYFGGTNNITPYLNVSVTSRFPNQCKLVGNVNQSKENATQSGFWGIIGSSKAFTNQTTLFFTVNNVTDTAINTPMIFQIICNSSSGQVSGTLNYSYYVDNVIPNKINLSYPVNYTIWSDPTPRFNWSIGNDDQCFSNYTLFVSKGDVTFATNVSVYYSAANTTNYYDVINLTPADYYWYVNVTDCAGNTNTSQDSYGIKAARTYTVNLNGCYNLSTGWQACGFVNSVKKNLSTLSAETGATTVSFYNITHQWQSYSTAATTVNNGVTVNMGEAVFLYIPTATTWETIQYTYTGAHLGTAVQRFFSNGTTRLPTVITNESMALVENLTWHYVSAQPTWGESPVINYIIVYNGTGTGNLVVTAENATFNTTNGGIMLTTEGAMYFNATNGFRVTYNHSTPKGVTVNNWIPVGITNTSNMTLLQLSSKFGYTADIPTTNASTFVFYNNTAATTARHVPFIFNWTINNATIITAGNVVWVEINETKFYNVTF